MSQPVIGFAGLTHLGLNMAAASAARGFQVVGYHDEPATVAAIAAGKLPISEPGLDALIAENRARLQFTADLAALATCDIVYISVDVPTDDSGCSDLSRIEKIIAIVQPALAADALLVILCQVPPGFTRRIPRAPQRLYYQVETLIFGRAVERAMHPERYIVGCADSSLPLDPRLAEYLEAYDCPILPMRYESAELAKISINICLIASVGVANTMAEICEEIGADWSEIVPALRLDRRIGPYSYIEPGLGLSGGNLERDLATVLRLSKEYETDGGIVEAWIANSDYRKNWPLRAVTATIAGGAPDATVAVLGLAYKADTDSIKNSPAIALIDGLSGKRVAVYDPLVQGARLGRDLVVAPSALDAVEGADVVAIMTPWKEFAVLAAADLAKRMRGRTVIDPYGMLATAAVSGAGLRHVTLGRPVHVQ